MSTEEAIILIVENEHIVAKDIQLRLKSFGYSHTHICVYPQSFFTLVEELNPDLVIMDIMLKNVSGIDLVKKLKEKYENIPVIFVTAHADPDIVAGLAGFMNVLAQLKAKSLSTGRDHE